MSFSRVAYFPLCALLIAGSLAWAQSPPAISEFPIGQAGFVGITNGPDGALWVTSDFAIARFTMDGTLTVLANASVGGMIAGPDGAVWYTDTNAQAIARITTAGVVTKYNVPGLATPGGITLGPDGALWFTEKFVGKIGRITTDGKITEYDVPGTIKSPAPSPSALTGITVGPDGALWFTDSLYSKIRKITTAGVVSDVATVGGQYDLSASGPGIVTGPDGAVWFTEFITAKIGRVTTSGAVAEFALPSGASPAGIIAGPDGALWFTDPNNKAIGRITTTGAVTEYMVPDGARVQQIAIGPDGALWFTGGSDSNLGRAALASNAPLQITTPATLPSATINVAYTWPLAAKGGTPPYTWSIASGSLPAGLSFAANGTISGTPPTLGSSNFSATVTDSTAETATATLGIAVANPICNPAVTGNYPSLLNQAGGSVEWTVSLNPGCSWTIENVPPWITSLTTPAGFNFQPGNGGTGNGNVQLQVAPNYGASTRSAVIIVAGVSKTIQQQAGLIPSASFMPHLAAEGGWRTTFTLVNKQTLAGATTLSFADNNGNPLALPLTLPQQPSAAPATEASIVQTIPGNAVSVVEASGPANVPYLEGSAGVTSTSAVDGFAIFHFDPSGQEAVVPMQNSTGSLALAFDNTNGVQTGVALQMINAGGGKNVGVTFIDDTGAVIGTGKESITLPQNGHTSFVLSTQFPETANRRGTIEFAPPCVILSGVIAQATVCSQVAALGMRYTPPGTLTTLPALPSTTVTPGSMAHIASGNGWQTTFVLMNPGGDTSPAVLNFYDDNGNPLSLPLTFLDTGATTTASSVTQAIPGALWIQTSGDVGTPLLTGSAQLVSSNPPAVHNFGALAIFRYNPNGQEAVVPLETRNAESYLLAFDNTNNTATGVAISVASSQAVSIPVIIRDGTGAQVGTATIPLAANGHTSFMLATQIPSTAGILGTVEFDTPAGAQISVLGIRSPPALTFTTLPPLAK